MVKPKSFRPWNPEQTLLLPPSPVDWLPENHLVFFLLDLAAELDLEAIHAVYRQKDPRGEKAYEPRMLVVLLQTLHSSVQLHLRLKLEQLLFCFFVTEPKKVSREPIHERFRSCPKRNFSRVESKSRFVTTPTFFF